MPPAARRYEDGEVDWNPVEETMPQGNPYPPAPTPDAAWHSNDMDWGQRSQSGDRRRARGSSIGNMRRITSSPPPLVERAPEHAYQGHAAYSDAGPRPSRRHQGHRPRQRRAYTEDDLLAHPFFAVPPPGHMHHSTPAFGYHPGLGLPYPSSGWGNEDAYPEEEEEYQVRRYHDQRHRDFTSSRREQEEGEFTQARRMQTERHGRGQSQRRHQDTWSNNNEWAGGGVEGWGASGGAEGRSGGAGDIDGWGGGGGGGGDADGWNSGGGGGGAGGWDEPGGGGGDGWAETGGGGGGGWDETGRGGGGDNGWGETGGREQDDWGQSAGGGGDWGNDGGERNDRWPGEGEENGTTIKSYKVIHPRNTERATQNNWGHVKSTPTTGPILVSDVPPTALERSISDGATPTLTGNGMKKLTNKLFGGGSGGISTHPFLRPPSLLRPTTFYWDFRRLPDPARSGIKIGEAVAGLSEPATLPPMAQIRLLVPIPTLHGASWSVDILSPSEHRAAKLPNPAPPLPYSFIGSPTSFGQKFTKSEFRYVGPRHLPRYVRVTDVLHGLHTMLFKPLRKGDWRALEKHHQETATKAFYMRCQEIEGNDGRIYVHTPTRGTEEIDRAVDENVSGGVRRVDVLVGRTRFDGIEPTGQAGEYQVRLGKSNDNLKFL